MRNSCVLPTGCPVDLYRTGVTCVFYFSVLGSAGVKFVPMEQAKENLFYGTGLTGLTGVSCRIPVYPFELIFTFC
jgi:hypothetical protein